MDAEERVLTLRRVTRGDLAAICALEQRCFSQDGFTPRQLRYLLYRARSASWVAEFGAHVVGYCILLTPQLPRPARLYSLAVLPECRGRGIAARLIDSALVFAVERGDTRVRLEVSEQNRSALRLYESLGFELIQRLPAYYDHGVNGLRMECRLNKNNPRQSVLAGQ